MHGVFDIIGPIMIGPSSSHTAGAVRLGLMARKVLGEPVTRAGIMLSGSFAQTYRGHGTDKALIAGVLGMKPDDERIRDSLSIAKEQGLEFTLDELKDVDNNRELSTDELDEVVGGEGVTRLGSRSSNPDRCPSNPNGKEHEWVETGKFDEKVLFVTVQRVFITCKYCMKTRSLVRW